MSINIIAATTNEHKVREIEAIIKPFGFKLVKRGDAGIPSDFEVEETGTTFEENSFRKAKVIADLTGGWVVADDSGLEIDVLNGAPGVYSARFADPETDEADFQTGEKEDNSNIRSLQDKANNAKLLRLLRDVPDELRTGRYVAVITLLIPEREPLVCRGEIEGHIGHELLGEGGFGYDPLFIPEGYDTTFGLISSEEKNRISHRYKALELLEQKLSYLK